MKKVTIKITTKQWKALEWLVFLGFDYINEELKVEDLPRLKGYWKRIKKNYNKEKNGKK
jgi:hypothetical protein